jgi:hypothetical protein
LLKDLAQRAYSNYETLQNSYDLALLCKDLDGDFVECGVAAGSQVAAMYRAVPDKKIWLFDSFEGIPLASKYDTSQPGIGVISHDVNGYLLTTSGITAVTQEQVKKHFKGWGVDDTNFEYVQGWFEMTIEKSPIGKISLLRLDGDLYNSTKVCLEHLYPKLIKGGWLIIDDYGLDGCRLAVNEYFNNYIFGGMPEYTIVPNTKTVIYLQKR